MSYGIRYSEAIEVFLSDGKAHPLERIAEHLDVHKDVVNFVLVRLQDRELVGKTETGRWYLKDDPSPMQQRWKAVGKWKFDHPIKNAGIFK